MDCLTQVFIRRAFYVLIAYYHFSYLLHPALCYKRFFFTLLRSHEYIHTQGSFVQAANNKLNPSQKNQAKYNTGIKDKTLPLYRSLKSIVLWIES